jgi:hypothetical protein
MFYVKVKNGVKFEEFRPCVVTLIETLGEVANEINKDIWITSANDGKHKNGSKHYSNEALDIRIKNLSSEESWIVHKRLSGLNDLVDYNNEPFYKNCYDVVLESDHIHVEYDPK